MAGSPDLFVVCKNCRAEVSPYITECPYCGHRLRKRAPKLEKGAVPRREKPRKRKPSGPSLPRLRPGELSGVRATTKPVSTIALVSAGVIATLVFLARPSTGVELVYSPLSDDLWRAFTTTFVYPATTFGGTMYELITLGTLFLFGWLLERRHGHWAPLVVYVVGTVAGMSLVMLTDDVAWGANAAALAMLAAWAVRDLLAVRRHEEVDSDLLGVAAIAVVMLLMPAAIEAANALAGLGGAVAGLLMGLVFARLRER